MTTTPTIIDACVFPDTLRIQRDGNVLRPLTRCCSTTADAGPDHSTCSECLTPQPSLYGESVEAGDPELLRKVITTWLSSVGCVSPEDCYWLHFGWHNAT